MRQWVLAGVLALGCVRAGEAPAPSPPPYAAPSAVWPAGAAAPPPGAIEPYRVVLEEAADDESDDPEVDDGHEAEPPPQTSATAEARLAAIFPNDAEIAERFAKDPASLGPISVGLTSAGALLNGVKMPDGPRWRRLDPDRAWGTQETIDALVHCIDVVNENFPETPRIDIGHISAKSGGKLPPHKSHQSGRDVDVGYYYRRPEPPFARATAQNLDLPRTWAFIRALVTDTDVELILVDTSIQKLLKEHALAAGEDPKWLDEIFEVGSRSLRPIVKHARGHATHVHVRFISPVAQELGRRVFPQLVAKKMLPRPVETGYVLHRAKSGDTLGSLAKRYGTTVRAIQEANNLRTVAIRAKAVYKIPTTKAPAPNAAPAIKMAPPVVVPPRRLPPPR